MTAHANIELKIAGSYLGRVIVRPRTLCLNTTAEQLKLPSGAQYLVEYAVRAGSTGQIVHTGRVTVGAASPDKAGEAAVRWAHDHDFYCDSRIDPAVEILRIQPAEEQDVGVGEITPVED